MDLPPVLCPSCRRMLWRRRKAVRWAAGLALLAVLLSWVGASAPTVPTPQMCKVYG